MRMRTNWMWMDVMRNSESETTRLRDYETTRLRVCVWRDLEPMEPGRGTKVCVRTQPCVAEFSRAVCANLNEFSYTVSE